MLNNLDQLASRVVLTALFFLLGWHLLTVFSIPPNVFLDGGRTHLSFMEGTANIISPVALVFSALLFYAAVFHKPQAGFVSMFGYTVILLVVAITAFKDNYLRIGILYVGFAGASGTAAGALFRAWKPLKRKKK